MRRAELILEFWFGELDAAGLPQPDAEKRWFGGGAGFDREIRARFEADLRNAAAGRLTHWQKTARGALALVLLFDQFPRNIYRGTRRAFLFDEHARAVVERAIASGHEEALHPVERVFLYMPLEHAEDRAAQAESVRRFGALVDAVPADQQERFRGFLRFATEHRDVIERYGRFPHRNAVLGRTSTPGERAYLEQGASQWGQGS